MPLQQLHHYLILANDLEATKSFYVDVLGLEVGERPPFPFPGYWLYLNGSPCVHLARRKANDDQADYLGDNSNATDTGALDHVAFTAQGLQQTLDRLSAAGVAMRRRTVPDQGLHQVFIQDPDGLTIELNFAAGELEAAAEAG